MTVFAIFLMLLSAGLIDAELPRRVDQNGNYQIRYGKRIFRTGIGFFGMLFFAVTFLTCFGIA